MTDQEKIQELKNQIKLIEEEGKQSQIDKYSYLVGTCISRATTSWEKITEICRVEYDEYDGDEIHFDCIGIYYDDRIGGSEQNTHATLNCWGSIYAKQIEKATITNEKFLEIFNKTVDLIKSKIIE